MANRWPARIGAAVLALLTACANLPPTPTSPPAPSPSPTLSPSATPTASPQPLATVEPVPDCLSEAGQVVQSELTDPALPRSLPYRVYLPPCGAGRRGLLPALFLLHGLARTDSEWDELGADELAQAWITSGEVPPFLIVMPWERLGLDFESVIVEHLIPHVEQVYGASPDRSLRAIGGISRGGGWALRIGLKHSELFGAIGLHSPAVLVPDLFDLPSWIQPIAPSGLPSIWIDMGERDPQRFELVELTDLLDEQAVPYSLTRYPGEHTESYWAAHLESYLEWYVSGWQGPDLDEY